MNPWLIFLFKSTLVLSILYLTFRLLMRNETFFLQSRVLLVLIVVLAAVIPVAYLPGSVSPIVLDSYEPAIGNSFIPKHVQKQDNSNTAAIADTGLGKKHSVAISTDSVVLWIYLTGVIISLSLFIYQLRSVLLLIRKSPRKYLGGIRLIVANEDIPAFSFAKYIVMSKHDFETNSKAMLTHELCHIKHGHFYDLMLMELVKIIYWFNPIVYFMVGDMKEIHEYQADEYTLKSGIDAVNYQLLIIQKSVGQQKFALANSFNHCQIKNRITMMNKSKASKHWSWKVAAFLPLLVILLMAFGKKGESPPKLASLPNDDNMEKLSSGPEMKQTQYEEFKQKIEIKKDGNYINGKLCSLEEIVDQDKRWREASNDWIFLLIDKSIPNKRVDEVRQSLKGYYWVVQATVGSEDLVYFFGDVSESAKFINGNWGEWLGKQLNEYPEATSLSNNKNYRLTYGFIVGKDGKVRDGHVIEGCKYPEINTALNKILSQVPNWEPAMRGTEAVSVYCRFVRGNNIDKMKN